MFDIDLILSLVMPHFRSGSDKKKYIQVGGTF